MARRYGYLATGQVMVRNLVRALSEEVGRSIETTTTCHMRVDEVRDRRGYPELGAESSDEHLSGMSVLPVEQSPVHVSATLMRVDEDADNGCYGLVDTTQNTHGHYDVDVLLRVQVGDRVHPVAPVLAFHHICDAVDRDAPNSIVVVSDQGDKRVHGGGIAADYGPPMQPEVTIRVRDGPGRRRSLHKFCHGRCPADYSGL